MATVVYLASALEHRLNNLIVKRRMAPPQLDPQGPVMMEARQIALKDGARAANIYLKVHRIPAVTKANLLAELIELGLNSLGE